MTDTDPLCAKCGNPRSNHPYRHPFVGPSQADTIKELEAKLAEVEAERDALKEQPKGITIDMANAPQLPPEAFDPIKDMMIEGLIAGGKEWKNRAEAAEANLPRAYRAGVEDAGKIADGYNAKATCMSCADTENILDAITALPTPTAADLAARLKEKNDDRR